MTNIKLNWVRHPVFAGGRDTHYAHYALFDGQTNTGYWVRWCRHPTALRKYWVQRPAGDGLSLSGEGFTTFRTVEQAKHAAMRDYHERRYREIEAGIRKESA